MAPPSCATALAEAGSAAGRTRVKVERPAGRTTLMRGPAVLDGRGRRRGGVVESRGAKRGDANLRVGCESCISLRCLNTRSSHTAQSFLIPPRVLAHIRLWRTLSNGCDGQSTVSGGKQTSTV